MAIINKDKYLKDIAGRVQRGAMYFEQGDRPAVEMGGRKVYVSSVFLSHDRGELAYTVANAYGDVLPSVHGMRALRDLDVRTISAVDRVVGRYAAMRLERENNVRRIASQVKGVAKKSYLGL